MVTLNALTMVFYDFCFTLNDSKFDFKGPQALSWIALTILQSILIHKNLICIIPGEFHMSIQLHFRNVILHQI